MADEQQGNEGGGGLPKRLILIIAGLMVLEAVAIFAVVSFTGFGESASAQTIEGKADADREAMVEIELVDTRFQNMQTGRVWDWEVQIYLKVRNRNKDNVSQTIDRRRAEIMEGVATIFRRAQHSQLREPGHETLNRQLSTYFHEVFGDGPDGMPRIERVLIPKCDGYPADF